MPSGTVNDTSESAVKSPNLRETWSQTIALITSLRHVNGRGHAGAQLAFVLDEPDPHREHFIGALVRRLQIARRILATRVDVLDLAHEFLAAERVDRDRHGHALLDVADLG